MTVDGDTAGRARAELVVEDLQRQGAVKARCCQRLHEVEQRQIALPGKVAEMAAPGQVVHLQQRRVGHLAPERCDRAGSREWRSRSVLARKNMKGIEHQADGWMVGPPHGFPGIAVVVDVAAPCQRLEGNAQAALGWPFRRARAGQPPRDRCRPRLSAATLLQIIRRSQPSSSMTSNLRSARANTRARWLSGMPSKSRNGCSVTMPSPSCSTRLTHLATACR